MEKPAAPQFVIPALLVQALVLYLSEQKLKDVHDIWLALQQLPRFTPAPSAPAPAPEPPAAC